MGDPYSIETMIVKVVYQCLEACDLLTISYICGAVQFWADFWCGQVVILRP